MAYQTTLLTLGILLASLAHAGGYKPYSESSAKARSHSESTAKARSESSSSAQGGSAVALGGSAQGGTGIGGAGIGLGGEGGSISGDISLNSEYQRSAPAVSIFQADPTAPFLKCFGIGGSKPEGSAVIGHCWIQRDAWGKATFEELKGLGLWREAAKARCSTRLLRSAFPKGQCETLVFEAITNQDAQQRLDVLREAQDLERMQRQLDTCCTLK